MTIRILLVAAAVLITLALIATAKGSQTLFGVAWTVWLCSSLLAYFLHLLFGWATDTRGPVR